MPETWLTPPDIARELGVGIDKVYAWIRSGELPACDFAQVRGGRQRLRIRPADFEDFLRSRQVRPPQPRLRQQKRVAESEAPEYV